jgi:hypothetical protein
MQPGSLLLAVEVQGTKVCGVNGGGKESRAGGGRMRGAGITADE